MVGEAGSVELVVVADATGAVEEMVKKNNMAQTTFPVVSKACLFHYIIIMVVMINYKKNNIAQTTFPVVRRRDTSVIKAWLLHYYHYYTRAMGWS